MFSDKYFDKFKSLCASDSSTMQIQDLRRIILFRSNGLCPARLIVSKSDGSYLSAKEMCNEDTYAIVKRKSMFQFPQDMEMFVEKARQTEIKLLSSAKCALGSGPLSLLHDLMEIHKDDCKAFRKGLLESKDLNIVAIHVCRWDGSPRRSMSEIRDAICLFPSSPQQMNAFLKFFLKSLVVLAAGVAIHELLLSESAQFSTHQCGATTVTLVGESHAKKLRGNFLPNFVKQLQQEGKNPQSVVFVEARPWEHTYEYMRTSNPKEFAIYQKVIDLNVVRSTETIAKYATSPVGYFQAILKFRHVENPLPHHEIVPYDYRALTEMQELYFFLKRITRFADTFKFTEIDVKLPIDSSEIIQKDIALRIDFQYQRLVEKFPDLASRFKDVANRFQQKIFTPNLSQDAANRIVNELWGVSMSIPDITFIETLKPYIKRGFSNIYAFMGFKHIPPVSKALEQQLACTSKK